MWLFKHAAQRCELRTNSNEALPFTSAASPRWGRAREPESTHSPLYSAEKPGSPRPGREDRSSQRPRGSEPNRAVQLSGAGGGTHQVRRAGRRARRRLCCGCCCSSATGHSAPAQREGRRRPAPEFLRPRPRRAGSAAGASSCRQRLSARRLTIPGPSRRRSPPGGPSPRGALAELGSTPRRPITHSLWPSNLAAPPATLAAPGWPLLWPLPRWPDPGSEAVLLVKEVPRHATPLPARSLSLPHSSSAQALLTSPAGYPVLDQTLTCR